MIDSSSTQHGSSSSTPIEQFPKSHAGIVARLVSLRDLPALLAPAARARQIAAEAVGFFREAVYGHHQDEERDLFPAVLSSAERGPEREAVRQMTERLTAEHRQVESIWESLEGALTAVAEGRDASVDVEGLVRLVDSYIAHATYEEQEFLPLSQKILGRNGDHMAALGISLHARHVLPELRKRFGSWS